MMNELTWEQEQDIRDYNIWLAEEQAKRHCSRGIKVGDRVCHVQFGHVVGVVNRIFWPAGADEQWAQVLWIARANVGDSVRGKRNNLGKIRLSALRLAA